MLPLFVECCQSVHGARFAGGDQFLPSDGARLTHENRYLLPVELEHSWCCFDTVPEADTQVSVDVDPETPYSALRHIWRFVTVAGRWRIYFTLSPGGMSGP